MRAALITDAPVPPRAASWAGSQPAWFWPVVLVGLALLLRLALHIGYQGHDDRSYIAFAWMYAHGGDIVQQRLADPWIGRIGAWLPSALFVHLFGSAEWVLTLNSLLTSLASVLVAVLAAEHMFGRRAAIVAGLLMVALPIDVFYGTRAFGDEATGFWCALTLLCLLQALHSGRDAWALATGLCWGVAYLNKETAVLMAVPFVLILVQRRVLPWRQMGLAVLGLAAVVAVELVFWWANTGDPLYRWHATLGSVGDFVPPPKVIHSWFDRIPSPIPGEVFRSPNTLLDALLMLTTHDEWGLLFFFVVPLALVALWRGSVVERSLAIFVLAMLLLLLFTPLHFPHYTLGRDPRHFTATGIPSVLLLAAWLARLAPLWCRGVVGLLLASWAVCLFVGVVGSDISTKRAFARALAEQPGERVWTNNIVASDAIVLSGFDRRLNLGIVTLRDGRVVGETRGGRSNGIRAMRPDLPVAADLSQLSGQRVALPAGAQPEPGWQLEREFQPTPHAAAAAAQRLALALGVPPQMARKITPSHGETIRLYRVPGQAPNGATPSQGER